MFKDRNRLPTVPSMIRNIMQNTGWSQETLAEEIGVAQSTVSRWLNGSTQRVDERTQATIQLICRSKSEKALLMGAGQLASTTDWFFLCAYASCYGTSLKADADAALKRLKKVMRSVDSWRLNTLPIGNYSFQCSIICLAIPLSDIAHALTYADDPHRPHRYLVLVDSNLNPERQKKELAREITAHVLERLSPSPFYNTARESML